jgi:hypothetical protein
MQSLAFRAKQPVWPPPGCRNARSNFLIQMHFKGKRPATKCCNIRASRARGRPRQHRRTQLATPHFGIERAEDLSRWLEDQSPGHLSAASFECRRCRRVEIRGNARAKVHVLVLEIFNICPLNPRNKFVRSKSSSFLRCCSPLSRGRARARRRGRFPNFGSHT